MDNHQNWEGFFKALSNYIKDYGFRTFGDNPFLDTCQYVLDNMYIGDDVSIDEYVQLDKYLNNRLV